MSYADAVSDTKISILLDNMHGRPKMRCAVL